VFSVKDLLLKAIFDLSDADVVMENISKIVNCGELILWWCHIYRKKRNKNS